MNAPVILPSYVRLLRNRPRATSAFGAGSVRAEIAVRRDVRDSKRQPTTWSRFAGVRAPRVVSELVAFAILALSMFVIAPASAQSSGLWALDCKGNSSGGASWNWLQNGMPISGAGGSAGCSGTMNVTGTSARPANANGLAVVVYANGDTNSATKSFDATQSFQVHLNAGASYRVYEWWCTAGLRCSSWAHFQEDAHFSLDG